MFPYKIQFTLIFKHLHTYTVNIYRWNIMDIFCIRINLYVYMYMYAYSNPEEQTKPLTEYRRTTKLPHNPSCNLIYKKVLKVFSWTKGKNTKQTVIHIYEMGVFAKASILVITIKTVDDSENVFISAASYAYLCIDMYRYVCFI